MTETRILLKSQYRGALAEELDTIYIMGFDAWAGGHNLEEYLQECRNSLKYKSGRWFVLCIDGIPVSSLLIHTFESWGNLHIRGIGSVATHPEFRKRGYGHQIVHSCIKDLSIKEQTHIFLLYSDIDPGFYESLGFVRLPLHYQRVQGSILMAKMPLHIEISTFEKYIGKIPGYF